MDASRLFNAREAAPGASGPAAHHAWAPEERADDSHAHAPFSLSDLQKAQALLDERADQRHAPAHSPFSLSDLQQAQALLEERAGPRHDPAHAPFSLSDLQQAQALLEERSGHGHAPAHGPFSLSDLQQAQALLDERSGHGHAPGHAPFSLGDLQQAQALLDQRAGPRRGPSYAPFSLSDLQQAQDLLERSACDSHACAPFSLSRLREAQALLDELRASGALLGGGGSLLAGGAGILKGGGGILGGAGGVLGAGGSNLGDRVVGGGVAQEGRRAPLATQSADLGAKVPADSSSWGSPGPLLPAGSTSTFPETISSGGGGLAGEAGALEPCPAGCTCLLCTLGGPAPASSREDAQEGLKRKRESTDGDGSICQPGSYPGQLTPHRSGLQAQPGAGVSQARAHSQGQQGSQGSQGFAQNPSLGQGSQGSGPAPREAQERPARPGANLASRLASIVRKSTAAPSGARPMQAMPGPQSNIAALSAAQAQLHLQHTGAAKGQVLSKAPSPAASALQPWLHHKKKHQQEHQETEAQEPAGEASGSSALVLRQGSGMSRQSSSGTLAASNSLGTQGLVLPKELLGAPPELADLTSMDDLPWLAPDLFAEWGIPAAALERQEGGLKLLVENLAAGQGPQGEGQASGALVSLDKARRVIGEADGPIELRLRKRLMALAEAVVTKDEMQAAIYTRILEADVTPDGTPMQRICYYMLEGLKLRQKGEGLNANHGPYRMPKQVGRAVLDFTSVMPYVEFWIIGMNCAIVDAAAGRGKVHIVDFGMWDRQWVHVFRKLQTIYQAVQAGARQQRQQQQEGEHQGLDEGESAHVDRVQIRFTAVELPPESGRGTGPATDADELRLEVMLAAAETGVDLDYEVVRSSLEDFDPSVVLRGGDTGAGEGAAGGEVGAQEARAGGGGSGRAQRGEALVVCLSTHLDTLPDSTVLRSNPRDRFLKKLVGMKPDVIATGNVEADVNTPFYMKRFEACLDLFYKYFLSFDLGAPRDSVSRKMFEGKVMARGIINMVVCDGALVFARYEGLRKISKRMRRMGLEPRALPPVAAEMLESMLRKYPPGFAVRPCLKNGGGLLSWDGGDLVGFSAWKPVEEVDDF